MTRGSGIVGARCPQLDYVKAFAILAVLVLHAVPRHWLTESWAVLHVWQAVPVFLVAMGVSSMLSSPRPYRQYLQRRALRLLPAWLVAYVLALVIYLLLPGNFKEYGSGPTLLAIAGVTPLGPYSGTYYVTLLLQFVFVGPIVVSAFRRAPVRSTVVVALANLAYEFAVARADLSGFLAYAASSCLLGFLFAVVLGFWLPQLQGRGARNLVVVGALSGAYLVYVQLSGDTLPGPGSLGNFQNALAFPYAAMLVLGGLRAPALRGPAHVALETLGRASWHIFLGQILFFRSGAFSFLRGLTSSYLGVGTGATAIAVLAAVVLMSALGVLWYAVEQRLLSRATGSSEMGSRA